MPVDVGHTERLRSAIQRVLDDGQFHDREDIVAATRGTLTTEQLLAFGRERDYRMVRSNARARLGQQDLAKWLATHPDPDHYEPQPRAHDPAWAHRQYVLVILGRMYEGGTLAVIRSSANGIGKVLYRWKGGEAATESE